MDRKTFLARAETFGLDTPDPWALPALRLLFSVPRTYTSLVEAWERLYPGTRAALDRLVDVGFVNYQSPVVVNTLTGKPAKQLGRTSTRYVTTQSGSRLAVAAAEDLRVLEETFPKLAPHNAQPLCLLLSALDLASPHRKFGLSIPAAREACGMADRSTKWWVRRLVELGYVRKLNEKVADVREVVPAHWRPTRALARQLTEALEAFRPEELDSYKREFRLTRTRYLDDVNPSRVGISGATDFDHDIECQRVLAALFTSPRAVTDGLFTVEPRLVLTANASIYPQAFGPGDDVVFYQPDAEITERHSNRVRRSVIEYERFQSRRDAWSHIERFFGYLAQRTLPMEDAVLRFVLDSTKRETAYVDLIEAFADYVLDYPDRVPANQIMLAVSSVPRLLAAPDPLADESWFRVQVPNQAGADTRRVPVLHDPDDSPYDDYFARYTEAT